MATELRETMTAHRNRRVASLPSLLPTGIRNLAGLAAWRLVPGFMLRRRLARWPLPARIQLNEEALRDIPEFKPTPLPTQPAGVHRLPGPALDAETINRALEESVRQGPDGQVLLPPGRIELKAAVRIPSGGWLAGSPETTELVFTGTNFGMLICGSESAPVTNVRLSSLHIRHGGTAGGFASAVLIAQASNVCLESVEVDSPVALGMMLADDVRGVRLDRCTVRNGRCEGLLLLRSIQDVWVTSCKFQDNTTSGVLLADWKLPPGTAPLDFDEQMRRLIPGIGFAPDDPGPRRIRFLDCDISGNRRMGICTDGAGLLTIERCRIHDNQCEGITLDNGTWKAIVRDCDIFGNGRRAGQSEEEYARDLIAGDDLLPDGSSAVKLPGVSMDNAAYCRIENCCIRNNYGDGVKFVRAGYRCLVTGNTISDNNRGGSEGHPHFGVRIGADPSQAPDQHDFPSSENEVRNNRISGKHAGGILLNDRTALNTVAGNAVEGALIQAVINHGHRSNRIAL